MRERQPVCTGAGRGLVDRKSKTKTTTLLLALVAALSGFVSGAHGHSQIKSGNVYDSGKLCVQNFTLQGHSYNSVQVTSATDSVYYLPPVPCGYRFSRPDGYLAARWESLKWSYKQGAWIMCGTQGYEYGGGSTFTVGRSTTGCGPAYYALIGSAFVYNGGWFGGHLVTDYEWLHD